MQLYTLTGIYPDDSKYETFQVILDGDKKPVSIGRASIVDDKYIVSFKRKPVDTIKQAATQMVKARIKSLSTELKIYKAILEELKNVPEDKYSKR